MSSTSSRAAGRDDPRRGMSNEREDGERAAGDGRSGVGSADGPLAVGSWLFPRRSGGEAGCCKRGGPYSLCEAMVFFFW